MDWVRREPRPGQWDLSGCWRRRERDRLDDCFSGCFLLAFEQADVHSSKGRAPNMGCSAGWLDQASLCFISTIGKAP